MYTKVVEFIFVVSILVICFFIGEAPSHAAYDPSSQSWGAASITGATGNVCTINRLKSGLGASYPWVSCTYNSTTSTFSLTFATGVFSLNPICDISPVGSPLYFYFTADPTTTTATVVDQTLLGVLSNGTFFITCR